MSQTDKIMNILKSGPKGKAASTGAFKQIDPVKVIRKGLPASTGKTVIRTYGLDDKRAEQIFGFSMRTLSRRTQSAGALSQVQSDRVYRFARVAAHAEDVFGNDEKAKDWLLTPNRALGQAPVDLLDTDAGTEEVEEVLYRIEHGIFS
jgi:putative toxin-antitoxin system antitoxin component (TIGR02293 family)